MSLAEDSLSIRAAWLAYIGGYTQEEIAERLGVSRVKAHRLIAAAMQSGHVKVFVQGEPAECIALEDALIRRYGLKTCVVVPDLDAQGSESHVYAALGAAGANLLMRLLEKTGPQTVGIGHGRTLAAVVDRLPHQPRTNLQFVSLIGSLTRKSSAHHFDVISRLTERTGGECYFLPVPFVADSVDDADVLRGQRSVERVLSLAREAELSLVGIGSVTEDAHQGMLTAAEIRAVKAQGAVSELLGHFLDAHGRVIDCDLNRRTLGVRLEELRGRQVLAIAGGDRKVAAIRAALQSGVLTGLIVNESTAGQLQD